MQVLYECRATHAACVIWDVEGDGDIHFLDPIIGKIKVIFNEVKFKRFS